MISFKCDYAEGAHPEILRHLLGHHPGQIQALAAAL